MTLHRRPLRVGLRYITIYGEAWELVEVANEFVRVVRWRSKVRAERRYVMADFWRINGTWITPPNEPKRPEFQEGDRFQARTGEIFTLTDSTAVWRGIWSDGLDGGLNEVDLRSMTRLPELPRIEVAEDATVAVDQHGNTWRKVER